MNSATVERLIGINRRFYGEHGRDFSGTRLRLQPGVRRIIEGLRMDESILDLGCGNGELARSLSRNGFHGAYLGLDFSLTLLGEAQREAFAFPVQFKETDLTSPHWETLAGNMEYDLAFAFAVLHHIPGAELRCLIPRKVHELLKREGRFILSNWQFLDNPRLKSRIQPWGSVGLDLEEVDPNDYLLDWRGGAAGLRYVHHFGEDELAELAEASGFEVLETFYSDGENKRSGLYQIWKKQS